MTSQGDISVELQVVLYSVIGLVSFISNSLIFLVIGTNKKLHTRSNVLLLSLALTDWLTAVIGVPIQLSNLIEGRNLTKGVGCDIFAFLIVVPFLVTNLNMSLIAIHRYFMVVRNNIYRRVFTNKNTVIFVISLWIVGLLLAVPPLVGWGSFTYNGYRAHCMIDWSNNKGYLIFLQASVYYVPLAAMCFSYFKIFKENNNSRKRLGSGGEKYHLRRYRHERRLTLMLLIVVCCFFMLYLPYASLIVYEGLLGKTASHMYSFLAMVFAYCNSMLDFWIYAGMSTQFRKALVTLMYKVCCQIIKEENKERSNLSHELNNTHTKLSHTKRLKPPTVSENGDTSNLETSFSSNYCN